MLTDVHYLSLTDRRDASYLGGYVNGWTPVRSVSCLASRLAKTPLTPMYIGCYFPIVSLNTRVLPFRFPLDSYEPGLHYALQLVKGTFFEIDPLLSSPI